jgi:hypothetical protein
MAVKQERLQQDGAARPVPIGGSTGQAMRGRLLATVNAVY